MRTTHHGRQAGRRLQCCSRSPPICTFKHVSLSVAMQIATNYQWRSGARARSRGQVGGASTDGRVAVPTQHEQLQSSINSINEIKTILLFFLKKKRLKKKSKRTCVRQTTASSATSKLARIVVVGPRPLRALEPTHRAT